MRDLVVKQQQLTQLPADVVITKCEPRRRRSSGVNVKHKGRTLPEPIASAALDASTGRRRAG